MSISIHEQILVEQRVANQTKSVGVAYLLLILLGGMGVHRFYLGRNGSGAVMLALFVIGWLTIVVGIGLVPLLVVAVWAFLDLFLIPGLAEKHKKGIREEVERTILIAGSGHGDAGAAQTIPDMSAQQMRSLPGASRQP